MAGDEPKPEAQAQAQAPPPTQPQEQSIPAQGTLEPEPDVAPSAAGPAVPPADDDDDNSDADSAVGSLGALGSTASLASSVMKFREENGRTYHAYKEGKYIGPNDNPEQERLDFQHALTLLTFDNKLYHAPVGRDPEYPVKRVLDVGTGTGCWAIDFADEHPEATVVGVDLSPIQPSFVPPNVDFQVDDLEETWTFTAKFDYIHSRHMTSSFADWGRFFRQAYDHLEPGGWFEVADVLPPTSDDGTLSPDTNFHRWASELLEGTRRIGRAFDGAVHYKRLMEEAGFANITELRYKWPQNRWPRDPKFKEIGEWTLGNIDAGMEAMSNAVFTRIMGWNKTELDVFIAMVRKDIRNPKIHAYWPLVVVYGQKPK